jgi:enoyl-CoA hydratase
MSGSDVLTDTLGEAVVVQERGAAVWARFNRPSSLNALDPDMVASLDQALDLAAATPRACAVVITGTGTSFCVGANLKVVRTNGANGGTRAFLHQVGDLFSKIERFPLPVIAAVNGLALAGGLELVLCCDLVIAASGARFGDSHANYGLIPGGGDSIRLPRRLGATRAKYLLYTGEFMQAVELADSGLINKIVPDDELDSAVDQLVASLSRKSPLGLRRMKQLVNDGLEQPIPVGLRQELLTGELHERSHDMQEGLAAFEEKREPRFTGQ